MNKKVYMILALAFTLTFSGIPGRVSAQVDPAIITTSQGDEASSTTSGEAVKPTRWGLFFLGVRERIALLTTFDPVAKAEKALKFANERANLAERLADKTDDPKVEERLDKMLKRASELEERADRVKDTLLENPDARAKLLLKNLLNFKEHKEEVFSKIEEKATPEQLERIKNMREQAEEKNQALMNALENSNIPEEVREHLEKVKDRIKEQQQKVEEFKEEQKELLDRIQAGDESAKEELETLRRERADEMRQRASERNVSTSTERNIRPLEKRREMLRENAERRQEIRQTQKRPLLPLQERPQN